MNTRHYFTLVVDALSLQVNANNYRDIEPLVLEVPEMKAELVRLPEQSLISMDMEAPMTTPKLDFDFFKSKTNQGVKPYKFMDDRSA